MDNMNNMNNMNSNSFSQNNLSGNTNGFNNYSDNLPQTVVQTNHTSSYNDVNAFYNYNNDFSSMSDNIPSTYTAVTPSNNVISDYNYQQPMSNDASTSQIYPQYVYQNPPQSNIPSLNPSLNITINSPHINFSEIFRFGFKIIIMPISPPIITNSNTQKQLQQGTSNIITDNDNSQTRFQQ
jgi:hypothetical protein